MRSADFTEDIVYQWQKKWSEYDLRQAVENCQEDTVGFPYFLKYLPKKGLILEAGCGLGQWVVYLSRLGYHMIGVEIVPDCVQMCKTHFPNVDIRVGDVRNLPFPDAYFDGYISIGVIEHMIEGPESILRELKRVIKPGGIAIITVPAYNYFLRAWYPLRKFIVEPFRKNHLIRKVLGKPALLYDKFDGQIKSIKIKKQLRAELWPIVGIDAVKGPIFIEYKYKKGYFDCLLESFDFKIIESVPVHHPLIFQDTFGNLFFKKSCLKNEKNNLQLNILGKIVKRIFDQVSPHFFNYLYLYVVKAKI